MNSAEYQELQNKVVATAQSVQGLDLDEFLKIADRGATFGCFIDPTLWRKGIDNLQVVINLARALKKYQEETASIMQRSGGSVLLLNVP